MASQRWDVFSVRCSWAGKNPPGPGALKGFKELIAHLMRSGFEGLLYLEVIHWLEVFKKICVYQELNGVLAVFRPGVSIGF